MRTVWKYALDPFQVEYPMPVGAQILHVGVLEGKPVLWALVNPEAAMEVRRLALIGTGQPILKHEELAHLGTVQLGGLVLHVFERKA